MIKVGITGASTPIAGELIRILINHPDVEIVTALDFEKSGHSVCSVHHGMMGETSLNFTEILDPAALDALIICTADSFTDKIVYSPELYPELRVIDLSGRYRNSYGQYGLEFGLSEINRKALVRGAKRAVLPSSLTSVALVTLYPFAMHLMLNSDIEIKYAGNIPDDAAYDQEIAAVLSKIQSSFNSRIIITKEPADFKRGLRVNIKFPSTLTLSDAMGLYEGIYDDHNFTFMTTEKLEIEEVEGTHKCLITVSKPDKDTMELEAIADVTMRGGAGEAVHVLNLLFGLHERISLNLKAINF